MSPVERLALALEAAQDTAPENTTPEGDDSEQSAVDTAPPPDADRLSEPLLTQPITRVDPGPVGGLAHSLIRGRHPVVRREGEVRVSASYLRTDNPVTGREDDGRGAFEYGVTDRFTLGAAVGPHTTTRSFALTRGDSLDHLEVSAMYGLAETRRDALTRSRSAWRSCSEGFVLRGVTRRRALRAQLGSRERAATGAIGRCGGELRQQVLQNPGMSRAEAVDGA